MQSYGIGLVVDPISEDIEFYCSPVQISQVILNLLNNSIDALKDLNSKRIQIRLVVESEKIGLAISDSGVGVKKEHIPNLFTPFFTTKEIGKGTGLGLSIAKGIIDAHHGNIYYDSSCAETRFVFLLPRVSDL
jgi:signal transduction histidine kinase